MKHYIKAHYDGEKIVLDEDVTLTPGQPAKVLFDDGVDTSPRV